MGGFPPPPSSPNPPPPGDGYPPPPPSPTPPPLGGGYPPQGPGGWPAPPPPGGAPEPQDAPPAAPFGAPGTYGPPPGYGYGGAGAEKAGFWARFAGLVIDIVVTSLFYVPAYIALLAGPTKIESCSLDSSGNIDFDGSVQNGICEVPTSGTIAMAVILGILGFVATLVYIGKLGGGRGQTLGQQALGIRMVDAATAQPIGAGRAIGRYFAMFLSAVLCYLGYFWMLWDPQKQTWHDKIVSSVVVKA